jgi:hypothetical protein
MWWMLLPWPKSRAIETTSLDPGLVGQSFPVKPDYYHRRGVELAILQQTNLPSLRSRNALKQPTRNIAAKKRAGQEDVDSDYLFGDCSQRAVSRWFWSKHLKRSVRGKLVSGLG